MLEKIKKWFKGYYDHRVKNLNNIINYFKLECSITTLLYVLNRRGYYKHTPEIKEWIPLKTKEERLSFAKKTQDKEKGVLEEGDLHRRVNV